jgi:hypothetical protein
MRLLLVVLLISVSFLFPSIVKAQDVPEADTEEKSQSMLCCIRLDMG